VERDQRFGGLDRKVLLYLRDDESDDRTTSLSFHVPVALQVGCSRRQKEALMHSVAIIARLRTGAEQQATELLAQGPPFDPDEIGLQRHVAYVCGDEVVFVFEGPEVEGIVDDLVGYPFGSRIRAAFDKWRPLIEELPRVARPAYEWEREAK
jgi:hypothetical protein